MKNKEVIVSEMLKAKGLTISTAESMTAGRLGAIITSVAGASQYYKGGVIAYSSELKQKFLGVPKELIDKYSVVSKEVAKFMAISVREKTNTNFGVSITGNAGPTTDINTDKVGQVFVGISSLKETKVFEFNFNLTREEVIEQTVNEALELLINSINK